MLPCQGCAYRRNIPGNCHIRCDFDWKQDVPAINALFDGAEINAHTAQWFCFPLNYDPVWGPDECPHKSDTRDESKSAEYGPMAELFAMLM